MRLRVDPILGRTRKITVRMIPLFQHLQSVSRRQVYLTTSERSTQKIMILRLMEYLLYPTRKSLKNLPAFYRSSSDRYTICNGLLYYTAVAGDTPRVVFPAHNDLRLRIMYECHDNPTGGHRGREKSYLTVSRGFDWPHHNQFVRKYIRACEVCQREKPSPSSRAPLQPLPMPAECWQSVSMEFVFGFPMTNTRIMVFLCL